MIPFKSIFKGLGLEFPRTGKVCMKPDNPNRVPLDVYLSFVRGKDAGNRRDKNKGRRMSVLLA
ncbi:hypothetical protein ACC695_39370, partial [Rhizobium ruizarguesonis]